MEHKKLLEEWFKQRNEQQPEKRQTSKSPVFGMRYGSDQKIK